MFKKLYSRNAFRGTHTFGECLLMATYEKLENHVSLFDRKKEKKISD